MLLGLLYLWEVSRPQISTQQGTCLTFLSYFLQKPEGVTAEVGDGCIATKGSQNVKVGRKPGNLVRFLISSIRNLVSDVLSIQPPDATE